MCGRYQFSARQSADLLRIAQDVQRRSGEGAQLPLPDGDVRPAQRAPVLVCRGGKVVSELQTWGLPGPSGRLIINARAETVTQKSLFRRSIAARRCVVPATAFTSGMPPAGRTPSPCPTARSGWPASTTM